jgi:hypothetical protein
MISQGEWGLTAGRHPHRLPFEGPPNDGLVAHRKLGQTTAGKNASLGDIKRVEDGDYIVATGTSTLHVTHELARDKLVHILAKVGGVERDATLQLVEEEHVISRRVWSPAVVRGFRSGGIAGARRARPVAPQERG